MTNLMKTVLVPSLVSIGALVSACGGTSNDASTEAVAGGKSKSAIGLVGEACSGFTPSKAIRSKEDFYKRCQLPYKLWNARSVKKSGATPVDTASTALMLVESIGAAQQANFDKFCAAMKEVKDGLVPGSSAAEKEMATKALNCTPSFRWSVNPVQSVSFDTLDYGSATSGSDTGGSTTTSGDPGAGTADGT